jgi:hypothetical protein
MDGFACQSNIMAGRSHRISQGYLKTVLEGPPRVIELRAPEAL